MSKPRKKVYTAVTANLNKDGSPMIVAWINDRDFDIIPISDGRGGEIKRVIPADPLHDAAPYLLEALKDAQQTLAHTLHRLRDDGVFSTSIALKRTEEKARLAILKAEANPLEKKP